MKSLVDARPAYMGGRDNTWRELVLDGESVSIIVMITTSPTDLSCTSAPSTGKNHKAENKRVRFFMYFLLLFPDSITISI